MKKKWKETITLSAHYFIDANEQKQKRKKEKKETIDHVTPTYGAWER